jgi:hypothetical protein
MAVIGFNSAPEHGTCPLVSHDRRQIMFPKGPDFPPHTMPELPQLVRLGLFLAPQKVRLGFAQHLRRTGLARGHKGEAKSSNTKWQTENGFSLFGFFAPKREIVLPQRATIFRNRTTQALGAVACVVLAFLTLLARTAGASGPPPETPFWFLSLEPPVIALSSCLLA